MKKIWHKGISVVLSFLLITGLAIPAFAAQDGKKIKVRVEGMSATIYSGEVELTTSQNCLDALKKALDGNGIGYQASIGSYGAFISSIDENGIPLVSGSQGGNYDGWLFLVNDRQPPASLDGVTPSDGDELVVYYGDMDTKIAEIAVSPKKPVVGQTAEIAVTAEVFDWVTNESSTVAIPNAVFSFNGKTYTTGQDGKVKIVMPETAGEYVYRLTPAGTGIPAFVRTGERMLSVTGGSVTVEDGNVDIINLNDPDNPVQKIDVINRPDTAVKLPVHLQNEQMLGTLELPLLIVAREGQHTVRMQFMEKTVIKGDAGWDGMMLIPRQGISQTFPGAVISFGVDLQNGLTFSKAVRIVLPGQSGNQIGYIKNNRILEVTKELEQDAAPAEGTEGIVFFDNGQDLILYTTSAEDFVTYRNIKTVALSEVKQQKDRTAAWISQNDPVSEWSVFALSRAGKSINRGYISFIDEQLKDTNGTVRNVTDLSKYILAIAAAGDHPNSFNGYRLTDQLLNHERMLAQGINGPVHALLALDFIGAEAAGSIWNQDRLIAEILKGQKTDGSFALTSSMTGDTDLTAMALTSLAPYRGREDVAGAVSKALNWLSSAQNKDGGFSSLGIATSESTSQVILALSTLGIRLDDARFVKNGNTVLSNLMLFANSDGSFCHTLNDKKGNLIASQQALLALTAAERLMEGKPGVFTYEVSIPDTNAGHAGLPVGIMAAALFLFFGTVCKDRKQELLSR